MFMGNETGQIAGQVVMHSVGRGASVPAFCRPPSSQPAQKPPSCRPQPGPISGVPVVGAVVYCWL